MHSTFNQAGRRHARGDVGAEGRGLRQAQTKGGLNRFQEQMPTAVTRKADARRAASLIHRACCWVGWRAMGKAVSVDLREWVVAAVGGGMSRRKAVGRFGISRSSAIRWISRARRSGSRRPEPQGGDQRSERLEAYA